MSDWIPTAAQCLHGALWLGGIGAAVAALALLRLPDCERRPEDAERRDRQNAPARSGIMRA